MRVPEQLSEALAGRYRVEREVGQGGMATVYLAQDLRHERRVALKVLSPELGAVLGPERFLGEIRVTANLQHPNLLPLFDSGAADGLLYYVMPFVEGESLRARLEREKQLPVDEAIRIAAAVASALDYAHRHNIIHRDLKPENILLHEGQPVVADFGIALAVSNAGGSRVTQTGISLGTPQYMSPEQATGDRQLDARSDVYSLGAVLYEMLAGEPPHAGTTAQAVIAKVLTDKPRDLRVARDTTPDHVAHAVDRALAKLPADRWQSAREFALALTDGSRSGRSVQAAGASRQRRWRDPVVLTLATLVLLLGIGALWQSVRASRVGDAAVIRTSLALPSEVIAAGVGGRGLGISADGRTILYNGVTETGGFQVFARDLSSLTVRPVSGTVLGIDPAMSPDGRWVAFTSGAHLHKVPVHGGPPVSLGRASLNGCTWIDAERLAAVRDGSIWMFFSDGRQPRKLTAPDSAAGELAHAFPMASSDGRYVFYQATYAAGFGAGRVGIVDVRSGRSAALDVNAAAPIGTVDDALVYVRPDGIVMAVRFDGRALRVIGEPVATGERMPIVIGGVVRAALARNGTLVYQESPLTATVAVVDSTGRIVQTIGEPKATLHPRFSPDGRRLVVAQDGDLWVYDLTSGTPIRLTSIGRNDRPEWTPDGKRVLYRTTRTGPDAVWWQPSDGSGAAEELFRTGGGAHEAVVSPDGKWLVVRTISTTNNRDVQYRALHGDTTLHPIATSQFSELMPRVSPDGRWVVYVSDESGQQEVYVRRFPGASGKWQISLNGGSEPVWAPDSRRIYYRRARAMVSATLGFGDGVTVTSRRTLFENPEYATSPIHANFDVSPDGRRFATVMRTESNAQLILVQNWGSEVRAILANATR